jgi:hypothetical protein
MNEPGKTDQHGVTDCYNKAWPIRTSSPRPVTTCRQEGGCEPENKLWGAVVGSFSTGAVIGIGSHEQKICRGYPNWRNGNFPSIPCVVLHRARTRISSSTTRSLGIRREDSWRRRQDPLYKRTHDLFPPDNSRRETFMRLIPTRQLTVTVNENLDNHHPSPKSRSTNYTPCRPRRFTCFLHFTRT